MSRQITGPLPTLKLLGRRNHHDFVEFRCVSVSEYEHVPVLLVTTVVFRANYQYISLDSMEKFLSYASNGISGPLAMHAELQGRVTPVVAPQ